MPFDATESAIVAEYARRNAGRLPPEESAIVDEYLRRSAAPPTPAAPTPQAIDQSARGTMTPRRPGDVIDQIAARRKTPPRMSTPPRLPSTPTGRMLYEGLKSVPRGLGVPMNGPEWKDALQSAAVHTVGFPYAQAWDATKAAQSLTTLPGRMSGAPSAARAAQVATAELPIVGKPLADAAGPAIAVYSENRAPTDRENIDAASGAGQLTGNAIAPKVYGKVFGSTSAEGVRTPGVVDFVRVHGRDRLAQSWFGRTAANAAEARRITQWISDRALDSLDASPRTAGPDGAASITGWGGDALHTQLLRERELAGSNVDAAVTAADIDGLRIDARDAVTKAYGDEIARLQREQGGRAVGVIRGLQQEMKAKLSQLAAPKTRMELVDAYRGINQQLTDAVRENPAKATDPFMRAEGVLRNELAARVKQTGGPDVARAFDEYHLANKAYESYGPMYDAMRTGSLKDPFTGVQTSIIQRIAGGPRTRMKTIGLLDGVTPEATKTAMRGSTTQQAIPPTAAAPFAPASAPPSPEPPPTTVPEVAAAAMPAMPSLAPETAPPAPAPTTPAAPSAPTAPAFPRTATALDTLRTAIEQARNVGDYATARMLTTELERRTATPPLRQGGAALLRPGAEKATIPLPIRRPGVFAAPGGGLTVGAELSDVLPQIEARLAAEHAQQTASAVPSERAMSPAEAISPDAAASAARAPYAGPQLRLPRTPVSTIDAPASSTTVPAAPKPTAFDLVNGTQGETASGAYAKMSEARRNTPKAPKRPERVFKASSEIETTPPTTTTAPTAAPVAPKAPRTVRTAPIEETVRPKAPRAPGAPATATATAGPGDRVAELRQQAKEAARRGQQMTAQRLNTQADRLVRDRARTAGAPESAAAALRAEDAKTPIAPKPKAAAPATSKAPTITGPASSRAVSDWSGVDPEKHPWRADRGDTIAEGDVRGTVRSRFITPRRGPAYSVDLKDGKTAMIFEDRITEHAPSAVQRNVIGAAAAVGNQLNTPPTSAGTGSGSGTAPPRSPVPKKAGNDNSNRGGDSLADLLFGGSAYAKEVPRRLIVDHIAKAKAEMASRGITAEQAEAYKPVLSNIAKDGIWPYGYDYQLPHGVMNRIRDIPRHLLHGFSKDETISPERDDTWRLYLGMPQKHNTFGISDYMPTMHDSRESGKPNSPKYYFKINGFFDKMLNDEKHGLLLGDDDRAEAFEATGGDPDTDTSPASDSIRYIVARTSDGHGYVFNDGSSDIMGNYTLSSGKDKHGYYISYYDRWDLQSRGAPTVEGVTLIGKPFEIYDRLYYDPKTFEPLPDRPARPTTPPPPTKTPPLGIMAPPQPFGTVPLPEPSSTTHGAARNISAAAPRQASSANDGGRTGSNRKQRNPGFVGGR